MKITEVKNTPTFTNPHGVDARKLYDNENAQVVLMTLQPGETLKPHITPVDVFFYVIEGTPEVLIGDEKITVHKDCLVESPKGVLHCLSNNSNELARILVVKVPRPVMHTKVL